MHFILDYKSCDNCWESVSRLGSESTAADECHCTCILLIKSPKEELIRRVPTMSNLIIRLWTHNHQGQHEESNTQKQCLQPWMIFYSLQTKRIYKLYTDFKFKSRIHYFNGLSLWMHIYGSESTWGCYSHRVIMELVSKQYVSPPTHTERNPRKDNSLIQTQRTELRWTLLE